MDEHARPHQPSAGSTALLAGLLIGTVWMWLSLIYLLQLEARNRLDGSPGESSPLYLALYGLPMVLLATGVCVVVALARRRHNSSADVARAWVAAATLTGIAVLALLIVPSYLGAMTEFVLLPWRVLTA